MCAYDSCEECYARPLREKRVSSVRLALVRSYETCVLLTQTPLSVALSWADVHVGTLQILASNNPANQDAVRECGGIPVLIGLADVGTDDQRTYAAGALNLTDDNVANCDAVRESGGVAVLTRMVTYGTVKQKAIATAALENVENVHPSKIRRIE
jgi:hypothetical protein